jgi:hypothetical protein
LFHAYVDILHARPARTPGIVATNLGMTSFAAERVSAVQQRTMLGVTADMAYYKGLVGAGVGVWRVGGFVVCDQGIWVATPLANP